MADTNTNNVKVINTRIRNKIANYSEWIAESAGVLLDGEIALVRVPTGESYTNPVTGKEEPVVELLMKVGNGMSTFGELPWLSAKASDVYNWAKVENPENIPLADGKTLNVYLSQVNTNTQAIAALVGEGGTAGSIDTKIANAIGALDGNLRVTGNSEATEVPAGEPYYVSKVEQTDGVVTTTYTAFPEAGSEAAGIVKLGVTGGAATYESIYGTDDKGGINAQVETNKQDIATIKQAIAGGVHFRGTVTAKPTSALVTVNGSIDITAEAGDVVIWADKGLEYIYTGSVWEELGDVTLLGELNTCVTTLTTNLAKAATVTEESPSDNKFVTGVSFDEEGNVKLKKARPTADNVSYGGGSVAETLADIEEDITTIQSDYIQAMKSTENGEDVYTAMSGGLEVVFCCGGVPVKAE